MSDGAHRRSPGGMPIIETRDLRKVFRSVKRTPGALGALKTLFSRETVERVAVEGITMSLGGGRTRRLHRAERRGQIDDDQDAHRDPRPDLRERRRRGDRPVGRAQAQRAQHRRRVRAAKPALLGPPARGVVRTAARDLQHSPGPLPQEPGGFHGAARDGRLPADAGAAALARATDARRLRGRDAARSADRLPRRADDRARRRRQGGDPHVRGRAKPRPRNDLHSHDPRPRRRRAPVPAHRPHRRGQTRLRRPCRTPQGAVRHASHARRRRSPSRTPASTSPGRNRSRSKASSRGCGSTAARSAPSS